MPKHPITIEQEVGEDGTLILHVPFSPGEKVQIIIDLIAPIESVDDEEFDASYDALVNDPRTYQGTQLSIGEILDRTNAFGILADEDIESGEDYVDKIRNRSSHSW